MESRAFRARLVGCASMLIGAASGCLRFADQPEHWSCATSADCPAGEKCIPEEPAGARCYPESLCRTRGDCGTLERCEDAHCVAVECDATNADACGPYRCVENACLDSCEGASSCQTGHGCRDHACVPEECTRGAAATDCNGFACDEGICRTACADAGSCASGYSCSEGVCEVERLAVGLACAEDAQCSSGICCPSSTVGQRFCQTTCVLRDGGQSCTWEAQCWSHACVGGSCQPCTEAQCVASTCAGRECGSVAGVGCGVCTGDDECDAVGICQPG